MTEANNSPAPEQEAPLTDNDKQRPPLPECAAPLDPDWKAKAYAAEVKALKRLADAEQDRAALASSPQPKGTRPLTEPDWRILEALPQIVRMVKDAPAFGYRSETLAWLAALSAPRSLVTEPPDAGHPLLQKLVDSIEIVNGMACWDYMAMYEVRDALASLSPAPSITPEPDFPKGNPVGLPLVASSARSPSDAAPAALPAAYVVTWPDGDQDLRWEKPAADYSDHYPEGPARVDPLVYAWGRFDALELVREAAELLAQKGCSTEAASLRRAIRTLADRPAPDASSTVAPAESRESLDHPASLPLDRPASEASDTAAPDGAPSAWREICGRGGDDDK